MSKDSCSKLEWSRSKCLDSVSHGGMIGEEPATIERDVIMHQYHCVLDDKGGRRMKQYQIIIEAEKELDIESLIKAKNCQPPNRFCDVKYVYRIVRDSQGRPVYFDMLDHTGR